MVRSSKSFSPIMPFLTIKGSMLDMKKAIEMPPSISVFVTTVVSVVNQY